jgi:hypothetical protein
MQHFSKFIFLANFILLSSCLSENSIRVGQIENIKLTGLENNAIICQAELQIENNYFLPFKLNAGDIKVYVSDKILGSIQIKNTLRVKAKEKKNYVIEFKFVPANGNAGILSLVQMFNKGDANFTLKGNIKAHSFLIYKNIPIDIPLNN